MSAAEEVKNAPAGRQAGGKANAAGLEAMVFRNVRMDKSLTTLEDYAKKWRETAYAVVEMKVEPSGVIEIRRRRCRRPVWKELLELSVT